MIFECEIESESELKFAVVSVEVLMTIIIG